RSFRFSSNAFQAGVLQTPPVDSLVAMATARMVTISGFGAPYFFSQSRTRMFASSEGTGGFVRRVLRPEELSAAVAGRAGGAASGAAVVGPVPALGGSPSCSPLSLVTAAASSSSRGAASNSLNLSAMSARKALAVASGPFRVGWGWAKKRTAEQRDVLIGVMAFRIACPAVHVLGARP